MPPAMPMARLRPIPDTGVIYLFTLFWQFTCGSMLQLYLHHVYPLFVKPLRKSSMYHAIVRRKITAAFAGLSAGKIEAITNELSPGANHYFVGSHALSGTRRTPESIRAWYERLLRLLQGISFTLHEVRVSGWPWRTQVEAIWTETNNGTDGVKTSAEGVNLIEIRWGRVTSVRIYPDTAALERTLHRIAAKGTSEALATPITS
jgi:ketosteroid isomerase-like protein